MTSQFTYRNNQLCCEQVSLRDIAERVGTPVYVYSESMIRERFLAYHQHLSPLPHNICYAVKANGNLSILRLLAQLGAGFDIVSGGELYRVLKAGGDAGKVVFSGVGKTAYEIAYAMQQGVRWFNCESHSELDLLNRIALELGTKPHIALRVNPDVDASTHPYISTGLKQHKFGIDISIVAEVYDYAASLPGLIVDGVSCHIGSQLLNTAPLLEALERMLNLVTVLRDSGHNITRFDFGGGLGVAYREEDQSPSISTYATAVRDRIEGRGLHLTLEPGRSIIAEAGVLLTRVLFTKKNGEREFVIADAAMNDLMRPALYQAYHPILPVERSNDAPSNVVDLVGPVCESGDFLAKERCLAATLSGDLLALGVAGAYGFVLSSQYNARPRAAEVLVDGSDFRVIRRRETFEDLVAAELV